MPKKRFPLPNVYALLEPGPVLLLTTAHGSQANVMTMSWHSMLEFEPPLVGCVVSDRSHSHTLLLASKECVLNIPTEEIAEKVVGCGNTTGAKVDKFSKFGLSRSAAESVSAPLLDDCFASLECRIADTGMARKYSFFVLEVIHAWVDPNIGEPRTLHHRGYGSFMIAGETITLPSKMR
ncbi:MAG: flavin reductase family protein [Methylobacter sp.]|uniref:flavin reductase family protein n=1 Tax=Methylovulum miyakonense TaxID=645578 RepID=UPI000366DB9E|nr:flavin reductase family protein [Methylovulum miyakonense]PPD45285.1 MAG: flavin reductase family protein [Methylobacter sp.]